MAALPHATPASHPQTVPAYPIDAGDGGCDCSQPTTNGRTWVSETDLITIAPQDALIDGNDGGSLYNIVAAKGIKHLLYAGVATNMCVMARHTAIVAAKTWGLEPILIRDLTDTMSAFPSATTSTHPSLLTCARARGAGTTRSGCRTSPTTTPVRSCLCSSWRSSSSARPTGLACPRSAAST